MAKRPESVSAEQWKEYAKVGAEAALKRLRAEIIAIERAFPELALPRRRHEAKKAVGTVTRKARTMSAAARKMVSERMKRYWAERRKAKAKVK